MPTPLVDKARSFAREQLMGKEVVQDALPKVPGPLQQAFVDQGLANWWIPRAHGGRGVSLEDSVDIVEALAFADAGFAFTSFISVIGSTALSLYGPESLKTRYLERMAQDGTFSATLGSEKEAGSELIRMGTVATREGDVYRLSGKKYFSTNAEFADYLICIAAVPQEPRAFAALLLPRNTSGVTFERRWKVNGVRGSATYQVALQDVKVPAANVLPGNGLRLLEVALNPSRTLIAATAIGICRRIQRVCLSYAQEKTVKGAPLLRNDVFAAKLGQMELEIEVMAAACKSAAREFDALVAAPDGAQTLEQTGALKSAVVAKMICGQLGWKVASTASEMLGGLGYTEDSLLGKLLRDVRYVSILEGGDDVLRDLMFNKYVVTQDP